MNRVDGALAHLVEQYLAERPPTAILNPAAGRRLPIDRGLLPAPPAPAPIDVSGVRWTAVQTAYSSEWRVAYDLARLGFRTYCPMGRKEVIRAVRPGSGTRRAAIVAFPIFARYLFVGFTRDLALTWRMLNEQLAPTRSAGRVVGVLGGRVGSMAIPPSALVAINQRELAGWGEPLLWVEGAPFKLAIGEQIRIKSGPFASFSATVDALSSARTIRALVGIFGRSTPVELEYCQVEKT